MKPPKPGRQLPVLDGVLQDLRSYARPTVRRVRGVAKATYNDLHRALGTGTEIAEPLREQWRRVLRHSADVLDQMPDPSGQRVLFATGYGIAGAMMTLESVLVMALRMRGASPIALMCDKTLPACEWNRFGNFTPDPEGFGPALTTRSRLETCRVCTDNICDAHGQLPIDTIAFSRVMRPDDIARVTAIVDSVPYEQYAAFVYRDIRVGEHAYSSTVRSQHRGTLLDDAETRWLFRRYLISSVLITDLMERVIEEVRPDCVVAMHGIYVTHGTICEVARKHGIRVVVYGTPYRKGSVWLSHRDTYHRTLITDSNDAWAGMELTPEKAAVIDDYLGSRRFGHRDYVSYNANAIEDKTAFVEELGLDPERPVIGLFTNIIWDAQLFYTSNAFDNILTWMYSTIRYFATRPDLQLVIRIHPAEVTSIFPTNQPILPEIMREFPVLPENVKVIAPESRLSSYTLAEISRATLIYGTKMGVEIAALGTPVILAGESFHRGKGYTYDVETKEEYFALLDRVLDLPRNSSEMVDRARKYAYHYFFRVMIDLPLYSVRDGIHLSGARLEFDHLSALAPGACPALDLICRGILEGEETPFHFDAYEAGATRELAGAR